MDGKNNFLTVAPFECAWRKDFKFREPGRGCVSFEAYAGNDVTVVFREQLGGQHYHYRMDTSPHYTVILGSHRNKRLKIVVDGKTVMDEAGVGLCCSSAFQSYWISIDNGLISVGNGQYPFQDMVFQWLDSNPNCTVQYVGLCSWDKHVGYRNVNVWPLAQNCIHVHHKEVGNQYYEDGWELEHFLENWELSDMYFVVGAEEKIVPAHKVILSVCSNFSFSSTTADVILLPEVPYQILHAFLQYIYTGQTHIAESQLASLRDLSLQLECTTLTKQCEASIVRLKRKALSDSSNQVEISHTSLPRQHHSFFSYELPIDAERLKQLLSTGEYSDVNVYVDDHGFFARSHKVILSLWSLPFTKMFTNGMSESNSSEIWLRNVPLDVLTVMLQFMYSGVLHAEDTIDSVNLVLQLLMLADQYGIAPLREECCKSLLNCLCEDWSYTGRSSTNNSYLYYEQV